MVTSQVEPDLWNAVIGEETDADSICDLVHDAHRIKLSGESIRKTESSLNGHAKLAKQAAPTVASLRRDRGILIGFDRNR